MGWVVTCLRGLWIGRRYAAEDTASGLVAHETYWH